MLKHIWASLLLPQSANIRAALVGAVIVQVKDLQPCSEWDCWVFPGQQQPPLDSFQGSPSLFLQRNMSPSSSYLWFRSSSDSQHFTLLTKAFLPKKVHFPFFLLFYFYIKRQNQGEKPPTHPSPSSTDTSKDTKPLKKPEHGLHHPAAHPLSNCEINICFHGDVTSSPFSRQSREVHLGGMNMLACARE